MARPGIDYPGLCIAFFCHDGQGNYILAKRSSTCRDEFAWDHGAGELELYDSVEGRLRDEVRQEYGAEILDFEYLGFLDVHRERDGVKNHWVSLDVKNHLWT